MAQHPERLAAGELDAIYLRRIRPDLLGRAPASASPIALVIGGQPGAGKSFALAHARSQLQDSAGSAVVISVDELREYHPYWRAYARSDPLAAERTQHDAGLWYARLTNDAIAQRVDVAFETSMRRPEPVLALAGRLRADGYLTVATIVATDRDQSRLATLARFDVARTEGDVPRFVPAAYHDATFSSLRDTLAALEASRAADELRLITRAGAGVYRNQLQNGSWQRPAKAVEALDAARERPLTARELANRALCWQTLVQRLGADPTTGGEVVAQAVAWRNEATERAERDPDARQYLAWGREAEAFRTMSPQQFLRKFPHHEQTVHRFRLAIDHFEAEFANRADREGTIAETRARFAERIAEGRYADRLRSRLRGDERAR